MTFYKPGNSHKHSCSPKPDNTHLLIWALVLLQIVGVLAILLFLSFTQPNTRHRTDMAALDLPPPVDAQPVLPVQPMLPTADVAQTPVINLSPADLAPTPTPSPSPTPSQPAALRIRGLEVTQGIQVFNEPEHARCNPDPARPDHIFCNNALPLVAGRHTLVRLYLACNGPCPPADATAQLRLLKNGQEQAVLRQSLPAQTLGRINNLPLDELRLNLANSLNFEFLPPPEWLAGQIGFEVTAGPPGTPPATLTLTKEFVERKPLRVAYVPIQYQGLIPPTPPDIDYWLLRMYPVPGVEYYRLPGPDLAWEGDLNKSEVLRKLLYVYWLYAQNNPIDTWPDQLFGWLPMEIYNGGISDPFWCPHCVGPHSSRVAFGGLRPEQDIGGPRILVHEIAHNLGAQHAWSPTFNEDNACFKAEGVDIQVDPTWPYVDTPYTQEFGIDLYSSPPVIYTRAHYDMMAYCTLPWISPYTYRKIFDSPFLQPDPAAALSLADFRPQVQVKEDGALLVSGIIYPNGTVSQPEVIRLAGDVASAFTPPVAFSPPPGDDYCLNVQSSDNTLLAQHCFDVGFLDMETGETEPSPYFFTLPDTEAQDIGQVSISKNQLSLVIVTPSNTTPQVNVIFPNGGESLNGQQTIIWEATDADGDPLLYDILYSPDNGQTWSPLAVRVKQTTYPFYTDQLPATHNALIRVIANDGFHTALDQSDAPFTIEAAPENSLSLRGPNIVQPGQTFNVVVTAHRLTEPGLFGLQFKLNFNPALLQVDGVQLHPSLNLVVDETIDHQTGQVSIVASRRGQVENLTGDLTLATFTLTAQQQAGQTDLYLSEVGAGARGGVRLEIVEAQGLSIHITSPTANAAEFLQPVK
ncbi:MAG: hypothetical protein JW953_02445 [Anaerolineae bacterium]|nr:hypothetical protein [Anaerolineae bacterium]